MTNLTDRMARIAWITHRDRQLAQLGMKPSEYAADIPIPDWAYTLADAVIAELSLRHVIDYCERQAGVGWRDVGTADEAMGRNIVAETVLTILEGGSFHGWNEQMDRP